MWPLFAMGVATTFGAVGAYRLQERAQVARAKAEIMVGISKVFLLGNWGAGPTVRHGRLFLRRAPAYARHGATV